MREYVTAADIDGHVSAHLGLDDEHVQMGVRALEKLRPADLPPLLHIQEQGWAVLECMFARMGDLAAASGRTAERSARRSASAARSGSPAQPAVQAVQAAQPLEDR
jgi:hypothetical protein